MYTCVRMLARQVLSDCIDLRRCLWCITFEIVVVDPHQSNNKRRLYWLVCKRKEYIYIYNSYTTCLVRVFIINTRFSRFLSFFYIILYFLILSFHNVQYTFKKRKKRKKIWINLIRTVYFFLFYFLTYILFDWCNNKMCDWTHKFTIDKENEEIYIKNFFIFLSFFNDKELFKILSNQEKRRRRRKNNNLRYSHRYFLL